MATDILNNRLDAAPPFPVSNKVYEAIGDAGDDCKCVWVNSLIQKLSNISDAFACKFCRWLVIAAHIYKTSFPSMFCVPGKAYPFKVLGPVVGLIPVDMINAKPIRMPFTKCQSNESMDAHADSLAVNCKFDIHISAFCLLRRVFLSLSNSFNCLFLAITNSRVFMWPSRNPNPARIADFKRVSLNNNFSPLSHFPTPI